MGEIQFFTTHSFRSLVLNKGAALNCQKAHSEVKGILRWCTDQNFQHGTIFYLSLKSDLLIIFFSYGLYHIKRDKTCCIFIRCSIESRSYINWLERTLLVDALLDQNRERFLVLMNLINMEDDIWSADYQKQSKENKSTLYVNWGDQKSVVFFCM